MQSLVLIHTSPIVFTVTLASPLKDLTVSGKEKPWGSLTDRQTEKGQTERKQDDIGGGRWVEGKYFTSSRICVQI